MNELVAVGLTAVLTVEGWILLELIALKIKLAQYETQLLRIVSDIESEKGTRKRLHEDFEMRIRTLETRHK